MTEGLFLLLFVAGIVGIFHARAGFAVLLLLLALSLLRSVFAW